MKHIKKFETLNSANGFIIPKPFVGSIQGGQTIACNEEGKKIEVNDGQIVIANAAVLYTLTWTVNYESKYFYWGDDKPTQAEAGETISVTYMGNRATMQIWINDVLYKEHGPDYEMLTLTFTMPAQNTTIHLVGMNSG